MIKIFDLGKFGAEIILDQSKLDKGLTGAEGKLTGYKGKLGSFGKMVGGIAIGAIAGLTAALGGAFAATLKVTDGFDNIAKTSKKLGVSTDAYQEMEYWASQNGIATNQMERAVGRLNQRMGLAAEGNEKYSSALEKLGVNMEDVRSGSISTEDAFAKSLQTLSEMTNEQEKSALASELFGTKLARDLMPALQDGSLSLEEAKQKAEELGIVIDEETLTAAEEFNDTWDDLTRSMSAFGQKIIAELMPFFQMLMDWIIDHMPQIQAIFQTTFDAIRIVFSTLFGWIEQFIGWIDKLFETNSESLSGIYELYSEYLGNIIEIVSEFGQNIWESISGVVLAIYDFIQEYLTMIVEFYQENGEQMLEIATKVFGTILDTVSTVFEAIFEIITTILNLILPFIQEQLGKITQFWDENGEKIMSIVETAFNFIKDTIDFIMPILIAIIEGAWSIISSVFDAAIGIILGLVEWFVSMLTGDFEGMKEASIKIWESLWDGVKGILEGAWNLLSGAFGALWNNIEDWFIGLKDDAIQWGKNMIDGFIEGIKSMAGAVGDAASNVIGEVAGFMKFWSPAKKGEGRFIEHWGKNMVDGFLDGVRQEASKAGQVIDDMIKSMSPKALDFSLATETVLNGNRSIAYMSSRGYIPLKESATTHTSNDNRNTYKIDVRIDKVEGGEKGADRLFGSIERRIKAKGGRI